MILVILTVKMIMRISVTIYSGMKLYTPFKDQVTFEDI